MKIVATTGKPWRTSREEKWSCVFQELALLKVSSGDTALSILNYPQFTQFLHLIQLTVSSPLNHDRTYWANPLAHVTVVFGCQSEPAYHGLQTSGVALETQYLCL